MALPARPRFLVATHIPHSVTVKYSLLLSQLIRMEAETAAYVVFGNAASGNSEYFTR